MQRNGLTERPRLGQNHHRGLFDVCVKRFPFHDEGHETNKTLHFLALHLRAPHCTRTKVLRVLGQRYPREVDAAVGKVSRYVAKSKQASEAAAASAEDDGIELVQAAEVDAFREATLSALLVSTFAGAELAQRLPLRDEVGLVSCVCYVSVWSFSVKCSRCERFACVMKHRCMYSIVNVATNGI